SAVDADDQRGPHLRCHAEVHQPDLAPARRCHSGCSRRSRSVNRRSAAATKSSSCGKSCGAKATRRASSATSSDRSRSGSASISSSSFCVASVTKSESHFVFFGVKLEPAGRIEVREPAIRNAPAGCLADCVIKPTKQLPSDASVPQIVSYPHASQHDDAVLGCQPNCSDDLGARPCCKEFIDRLN